MKRVHLTITDYGVFNLDDPSDKKNYHQARAKEFASMRYLRNLQLEELSLPFEIMETYRIEETGTILGHIKMNGRESQFSISWFDTKSIVSLRLSGGHFSRVSKRFILSLMDKYNLDSETTYFQNYFRMYRMSDYLNYIDSPIYKRANEPEKYYPLIRRDSGEMEGITHQSGYEVIRELMPYEYR